MTREFEQYAIQLKEQKLLETEALYQAHLEEYKTAFLENFRSICENILHLQNECGLGKISYLEYTLLYTSILNQQYSAEIRIYNKNWYFDSGQRVVGHCSLDFPFAKYHALYLELMAYRKRFAGAVTAREVLGFVLPCAGLFYKYVVAALRYSIPDCAKTELFQSIQRSDEFEINVGEYMGNTEAIYKENRKRTSEETLAWFQMRHEFAYSFEDFSGLDFSGADLSEIDLRYADLTDAKLTDTDFQDAMLFGTRFCHANLQGADLRYCLMHEADFSGADMTNTKFYAARAYRGLPNTANWIIAGYRSVSFRNANLTNADFNGSKIRDADFTGAKMDGTRIRKSQLVWFRLSPEQKNAVQLLDE